MSWYKTASEVKENEKRALKQHVNKKVASIQNSGVEWNGYPVQTDPVSRSNISNEALSVTSGIRQDGETFRMGNNQNVSLTNGEMLDMASTVRSFYKNALMKGVELKEAIDAGEISTVQEIENVNWP